MLVTTTEVNTFNGWSGSTYDTRIATLIPIIQMKISEICNNLFTINWNKYDTLFEASSVFVFEADDNTITNLDAEFSTTSGLGAGDTIRVIGSYKNDGYHDIESLTDTVLTIADDTTIIDEDLSAWVTIAFVKWPAGLKLIASEMIRYDLIDRYKTSGVKSESIDRHTTTFDTDSKHAKNYGYPGDVIAGLDVYMISRFL